MRVSKGIGDGTPQSHGERIRAGIARRAAEAKKPGPKARKKARAAAVMAPPVRCWAGTLVSCRCVLSLGHYVPRGPGESPHQAADGTRWFGASPRSSRLPTEAVNDR
jgi:hypothetical protein